MNFLAHLYLSGDNVHVRLGNFIGDHVKGKAFTHYPPDVQKGILMHRAIDSFTDNHLATAESKRLLRSGYGKYAGVVVDVFYDHVLAKNWSTFSGTELNIFAQKTYSILEKNEEYLPEKWAATLYKGTLPIAIRILGWIELIFMLMMWIGLLKGIVEYILYPLYKRERLSGQMRIWITGALLIGATIGMTGGFGYARLRLPIEPLLIILSLTILIPWIFQMPSRSKNKNLFEN